jgi:copper chaperone CopZ
MTTTTVLNVNGMKCMHCKKRVEDACMGVKGVLNASASLEGKTVTIDHNDASIEEIKKAIIKAGYDA